MANDVRVGAGGGAPGLTVIWTCTTTYTRTLPLPEVAGATGSGVEELAADPSLLHGVAGAALAARLTSTQNTDTSAGIPEVEIVGTYLEQQPTLVDLVAQARLALQPEAERVTPAGRALAALLAGLSREQVIDR